MLKNLLQIVLVTYNRKFCLSQTLSKIFSDDSPIKDLEIVVLDNHSTDGSSELIDDYCKKHKNLKHIIHNRNIGGNANICRAFEVASQKYLWVLCDDDMFDWTHWHEIEEAIISDKYDMIYTINHLSQKNDKITPGYLAFLAAFLPGVIYKTDYITNDIMQNMYGMIHTWYTQSILSLHILFNFGGEYYLPKRNLIIRGVASTEKENIASLTRGIRILHPDLKRMFWHVGFVQAAQIITDEKIRAKVIETTNFDENYKQNFYKYLCAIVKYNHKWKNNSFKNVMDICFNLNFRQRLLFLRAYCSYYVTHYILEFIFSIKNRKDKKYKIVKIFGIQLKFKRQKKER